MARLSKTDLADRSRYQFKAQEVEIPELGGSVEVKVLSVSEREKLPDLVDENGKAVASVRNLAGVFAGVVSDPKLTPKEAEEFLGDLPSPALDRVVEQFGELLSVTDDDEEESADNRRDFRPESDRS